MRLTFIYFFILIFISATLSGQETAERRFKGGIVAGFNLAQVRNDAAAGYNKIGIQAGARVAIVLQERMDLGIEMLFSQRGSASRNANQGRSLFKMTLNYIEVPLIFNYMDWKAEDEDYYRLHFHSGFSYGRLISFSGDFRYANIAPFVRDNDVSWIGGATYYVNEKFGITARYTRSLYPFFTAQDVTGTPNEGSLLAFQLTFQTVYMF